MRRSVMRFVRRRSRSKSNNRDAFDATAASTSNSADTHNAPVSQTTVPNRQESKFGETQSTSNTTTKATEPKITETETEDPSNNFRQRAMQARATHNSHSRHNSHEDTESKSETDHASSHSGSVSHKDNHTSKQVDPPPWVKSNDDASLNSNRRRLSPPPTQPPPLSLQSQSHRPQPPQSPPPEPPSSPPPPLAAFPPVMSSRISSPSSSSRPRNSSASSHEQRHAVSPPRIPEPPPSMPPPMSPLTELQRTVRGRSIHQNMVASELKQRIQHGTQLRSTTKVKKALPPPLIISASNDASVIFPDYQPMTTRRPSNEVDKTSFHQAAENIYSSSPPIVVITQEEKESVNAEPARQNVRGQSSTANQSHKETNDTKHNSSGNEYIPPGKQAHDHDLTSCAIDKIPEIHRDEESKREIASKNSNESSWEQELEDVAVVRVVDKLPREDVRARIVTYLSPGNTTGIARNTADNGDAYAAVRRAQRHLLKKDAEEARRVGTQQSTAATSDAEKHKNYVAIDTDALIQHAPTSSATFSHPVMLLSGEKIHVGQSTSTRLRVSKTNDVNPAPHIAELDLGVEGAMALQTSAAIIQRAWAQGKQRDYTNEVNSKASRRGSAFSINTKHNGNSIVSRGDGDSIAGEYERARRGVLSRTDKDLCLRLYETVDGRSNGALTAVNLAGGVQRHALRVRGLSTDGDARELVMEAKHEILVALQVSPHDRLAPARFVDLLGRDVRLHRLPSACLRLAMHLQRIGALGGQSWDTVAGMCRESWTRRQRSDLLGGPAVRALYRLFALVADASSCNGSDGMDFVSTAEFVEHVAFLAVKTKTKASSRNRSLLRRQNSDENSSSSNSTSEFGWMCSAGMLRTLYGVDPGRTGRVSAHMLVMFVESNFASQKQSGTGDMLLRLAGHACGGGDIQHTQSQ